jgi:transposase
MTLRVRELNDQERVGVQRIARSHTLAAALVRRAQIVVHAMDGLKAEEIATRMDLCGTTVRHWLIRFNARGLEGLKEDVRTGRPPTYSAEQRSTVITAALTRPSELGLPFASWTLDRLVSYLSEQGIAMRRSRISEILIREGLRWRQDETWFGARVDPDFAKKGGDRTALHGAADRQRSHLPGRDGTAEGQEPSRPAARPAGGSQGRTGPAGDRLRPPPCRRLCFRRLPAGQRQGFHPTL